MAGTRINNGINHLFIVVCIAIILVSSIHYLAGLLLRMSLFLGEIMNDKQVRLAAFAAVGISVSIFLGLMIIKFFNSLITSGISF